MSSSFFSDPIEWLDDRLNFRLVLYVIVSIFFAAIIFAILVTLFNIGYYWKGFGFCIEPECLLEFPKVFSPQVRLIKFGAAASSFVVLVFGSYLALRSYLTSMNVGVFGNRIAHIGFFERFMQVELMRRRAISPKYVDVYSIYRLMFPKGHLNSVYASESFVAAVRVVYDVINHSSERYNRDRSFIFEDHRRSLVESLQGVHIEMDGTARIDFLEVEDEVVDFLAMLCRVFADSDVDIVPPSRDYR